MDTLLTCYLLSGLFAYLGLLLILRQKRRRSRRRYWVRPWLRRRDSETQQTMVHLYRELLLDGDVLEFRSTLRMNPDVYAALLDVLKDSLTKKHTNFRKPISAETRLAVTLRYLALGDCFRSISQQFRIGLSTTRLIVRTTCKAIINVLQNRYLATPTTTRDWLNIASDFNNKWHFPNCIGAIDGKHIRIVQPCNSGTYFYNYKGYYSIVLLGISDADYKFLYVNIGAEGKASDGGIWSKSSFYDYINDVDNPLDIPQPCQLPGTSMRIPYFLVGDDAFRLSPNLIKRFPGADLTHKERIFNYRLSRCRRIVENCFGILTCRFRIFMQTIEVQPNFVDDIVMACCILHNYLRIHARNDYIPLIAVDHELDDGRFVPGAWRQETNLDPMVRNPQKNATQYAKTIRTTLCDYFVSRHGAIPWQNNM